MTLTEFKKKHDLTYRVMEVATGIPRAILHRICETEGYCVKLHHANAIVTWTNNAVTYEDLLPEGC